MKQSQIIIHKRKRCLDCQIQKCIAHKDVNIENGKKIIDCKACTLKENCSNCQLKCVCSGKGIKNLNLKR
jgi:hypothetical protein